MNSAVMSKALENHVLEHVLISWQGIYVINKTYKFLYRAAVEHDAQVGQVKHGESTKTQVR